MQKFARVVAYVDAFKGTVIGRTNAEQRFFFRPYTISARLMIQIASLTATAGKQNY